MNVREMLITHPQPSTLDKSALEECIRACFECVQACTSCADACLAEDELQQLRRCIRLNLDCADVCLAAGRVLSRQTEPVWDLLRAQVGACYRAAQECAQECGEHADMHEHCRICAESCRRCEESCSKLLKLLEKSAVSA